MDAPPPIPETLEEAAPAAGHPPGWRLRLQRLLLAGLALLVPVALTGYVLYQLFLLMDGLFAPLLERILGWRFPGLGLLLTLAIILLLGWLSANVVGRRLIQAAERIVHRIPIGRAVYSSSKSVLQVLSEDRADAFKRVVLIEYPHRGSFALAFVTGTARWAQIHPDIADARIVFLPTAPNPTSGYLLIVPRDQVFDLPISVEEGFRMVLSGGILLPKLPAPGAADPPAAGVPSPGPDSGNPAREPRG